MTLRRDSLSAFDSKESVQPQAKASEVLPTRLNERDIPGVVNLSGDWPHLTLDFGNEKAQSVLMQTWDNRKIADLTPESFDCLWAELERYRRNPLNLTTEQLAEIKRRSEDLVPCKDFHGVYRVTK